MAILAEEFAVNMFAWLKSLFASDAEEESEFIPRELGPGDRFLSKSSGEYTSLLLLLLLHILM